MQGERLEPLGASDDRKDEIVRNSGCSKCVCLENEKDFLQTSLFTLTTYFAQVQFRLRQVVDAPFEDQEDLLKSLEEFAFTDVNLLESNDRVGDNLLETIKKRRDQQKVLLGRLKSQLRHLKEFSGAKMTWNELLENVRMKENLEQQLRTQIVDLERFIQYLKSLDTKCMCKRNRKSSGTFLVEAVDRIFSFLQMFALLQFTWGSNCFTSDRINQWADLRARLELAIIDLKKMLHTNEDPRKITTAVRKCLATSIKDLMEHGTKSQLPFLRCFSHATHGWDIILFYYHFKRGVSPKNSKKNLLCAIEEIISTHSRYKRSHDSHFRAFVCAALNAKRLVPWLNLIFHCGRVIETFYYPWSYVATTRYQDSLRSLEALTPHKFDLPVDLDVRKFQIEDNVFS
ncbi:RUN domain-containing protein 1-like [Tribolium madens]|uniref:RUN domain-containing protein 1-like n=1 Tax=Tribolium madens TaxID=41895 RepID=UPI001CF7424F|nr:RUN domain-containing protein 1-like [Tribolium madens]